MPLKAVQIRNAYCQSNTRGIDATQKTLGLSKNKEWISLNSGSLISLQIFEAANPFQLADNKNNYEWLLMYVTKELVQN